MGRTLIQDLFQKTIHAVSDLVVLVVRPETDTDDAYGSILSDVVESISRRPPSTRPTHQGGLGDFQLLVVHNCTSLQRFDRYREVGSSAGRAN